MEKTDSFKVGLGLRVLGAREKLNVPENIKVECEELLNCFVSAVLIEEDPNVIESKWQMVKL